MSVVIDAMPRVIGAVNGRHGSRPQNHKIAECGVTLDLNLYAAWCASTPLELTAREFDLLKVLVEQHDRVVPRRELHGRVWPEGESKARVVDTYVSRLRRKLTDAGHPGIRAVHMRGYRLLSPADSS